MIFCIVNLIFKWAVVTGPRAITPPDLQGKSFHEVDRALKAENALVICAANNQHRYGNHLNACPWCERTERLGGRDPFPSLQAVQSRQHLQPIQPKRVNPTTRTVPTQTPLLVTIPAKRFSPFVLGLFGVSVCGFLAVLVIVKDLNLAPETSATPFPTTSDTAEPNRTTNSGKSSVAYYNQGNASYKLGDYEGAIENFSQALRINPNDAKAYVNRGSARYEIAQYSPDPDR